MRDQLTEMKKSDSESRHEGEKTGKRTVNGMSGQAGRKAAKTTINEEQ